MSDLVEVTDMQDYLGVSHSTDTTVIGSLLTSVEDALERACDRVDRPFQDAETNRTEVHDGEETDTLWLDYPIEYVSSITLGLDVNDPDEELNPDDLTVVVWGEGRRKLQRVDGNTFGPCYPRYVTIEYDAQADLPAVAKLAVMRGTAMLYRQRGSEDAVGHNESLGDYSHTLAKIKEDDIWQMAVEQCARPVIV